jgi:hypothetical protein
MEHALSHCERLGLNVIPLIQRDKRPALRSWFQYQQTATTQEQRARWFSRPANIGIVTGAVSDLIVVDCDTVEVWRRLVAAEPRFQQTLTVRTGRGMHIYIRPDGETASTAFVLDGVTNHVKGDGGYVVGFGSVHPSGALYEAVNAFDPIRYSVPALLSLLRSIGAAVGRSSHGGKGRSAQQFPDPGDASVAELFEAWKIQARRRLDEGGHVARSV